MDNIKQIFFCSNDINDKPFKQKRTNKKTIIKIKIQPIKPIIEFIIIFDDI